MISLSAKKLSIMLEESGYINKLTHGTELNIKYNNKNGKLYVSTVCKAEPLDTTKLSD